MKNSLFKRVLFFTMALVGVTLLFAGNGDDGVIMATASFAALNWEDGQNNMGGFKNFVVFYPAHLCQSVPQVPSEIAQGDDYVEAVGAFTMVDGEEPIFIYATDQTVKYAAEAVGETDGISFEQKGEFFYPGNKKEAHSLATRIKNMKGYIVIEDSDGQQQLIGSPGLEAVIKPSYDGGQKRSDRRGLKFEFSAPSNQTAVFLGTKLIVDPVVGSAEYEESSESSDPEVES